MVLQFSEIIFLYIYMIFWTAKTTNIPIFHFINRVTLTFSKIGQRLTYLHGNFALVYGGIDEGIHFGASQPKDTCLETEEYIHVPHIYGYKWSHSTVIHFMQGHKKT